MICNHFTAVGFLDESRLTKAAAEVVVARPPQCNWVADADKVSGHNFKIVYNQSRAECCAACFALPLECEAYVRDPVAQTCYLITGVTSNTTVKSSKREVGFTNTKLPPPPPQELWPARDLLPLADRRAQVVAPFSHPPSSFFTGSGSELGSKEYVYSRNEPILPAPHAEEGDGQQGLGGQAAPAAPQQQKCASWVAVDKPVMFEPIADLQHGSPAQQINLSPRLKGASVILLGEAHKFAAVSTYRFGSVEVMLPTGGLSIVLRGNVGESVALRFVSVAAGGLLGACETKVFKLAHNGETTVQLP